MRDNNKIEVTECSWCPFVLKRVLYTDKCRLRDRYIIIKSPENSSSPPARLFPEWCPLIDSPITIELKK